MDQWISGTHMKKLAMVACNHSAGAAGITGRILSHFLASSSLLRELQTSERYPLKVLLGCSRVWWYMHLIPVLGRQRWADLCEFQGSQHYMLRRCFNNNNNNEDSIMNQRPSGLVYIETTWHQ